MSEIRKGMLLVISGPSGTGKGTLIEKLMKENPKCTIAEAPLVIKDEINSVCEHILDNTAVFKKDEQGMAAFEKFLASVNIK